MSFIRSVTKAFTTDASGAATVYTDAINGRVLSVIFTNTDAASTSDFTITTEDTAQAVLTLTNQNGSGKWQPRQATHDTSGAAETYDATEAVNDYVFVADERIKIVVAQGGDTKTGTFTILYG